eukprot:scaffold36540_cov45-Phaeocystis_antarctica.AAC.1
MRDPAARLGAGPTGTADVMADGFFAPLDFAQVMQRAYTPEWRPPQPSPDDFNSRYHYKLDGSGGYKLDKLGGDEGGEAREDKDDDDDDDDEDDEDDDEAGPLPVCTTDDELEFAAMGAPTLVVVVVVAAM